MRTILLLVLAASTAPAHAALDLSWWTLDGGGGRSAGGPYVLQGTVGQPDASASSGGTYVLAGGFWSGGDRVTAVDGPEAPSLPALPRLRPAVPNPFNPRVVFRVDLPRAQEVDLRVFDAAGRLVRVLAREIRTAGTHEFRWDGTDDSGVSVASGVFFVQLRAGNHAARQKVALVR